MIESFHTMEKMRQHIIDAGAETFLNTVGLEEGEFSLPPEKAFGLICSLKETETDSIKYYSEKFVDEIIGRKFKSGELAYILAGIDYAKSTIIDCMPDNERKIFKKKYDELCENARKNLSPSVMMVSFKREDDAHE